MKWRVILLFALRRSKVLSNEQFCLPVCYLSEVLPDLVEETVTSDRLPLRLLKGLDALWLRFLLPPRPNCPAQINPLSVSHKENGHGWVWFISHWAIIRAQSVTHLPHKTHTPQPSWPFFSPSPHCPALTPPVAHSTCHTEEDTRTKTSQNQKELISHWWCIIVFASGLCARCLCACRVALSIIRRVHWPFLRCPAHVLP